MTLDKLRYSLTKHSERLFFTYENLKLLIHPSMDNQNDFDDLLNRLIDDIELMPEIKQTQDKVNIKFYRYDYNEEIFYKDELLAFIFASINVDWDIIKGIDIYTGKGHFWLKNNNTIFDPSLSIITSKEIYSKRFKQLKEIKNKEVINYLKENNNLYKFYEKGLFKNFRRKNNPDFSINFINKILKEFNKNIEKQYTLNDKVIKEIKEFPWKDNFLKLRQVLTHKRKSYIQSSKIAVYPSIDESILDEISKTASIITDLMKKEYKLSIDYYNNTVGNCYALSILFSLSNENFKLIQGGIPYTKEYCGKVTNHIYQHSWLEKDDIVYDPALRIVVPKDLYYIFVQRQDVYTKEETEEILRRIGFNLTHFRDFMNGIRIGKDESICYRCLVNEIDSKENRVDGEKLITLIKTRSR